MYGRAYSRDPSTYDNPEAFMPERFLTPDGRFDRPDVRDPAAIAFGYGRRRVSSPPTAIHCARH